MKSLSKIILFVAALVSLLLVVGIYALFSGFGERMMQHAAFAQSEVVARLTFSNMFQLMTQGWKREQVLAFTRRATDSLAGSPLRIQSHRGEPVGRDYGAAAAQGAPDQAVTEALRTGRSAEVLTPTGARFVYALKAEESCLRCHAKAAKGEVLGVISVETRYEQYMGDTRKLLMLILVLLAPLPFIAASDCFAMASSHEPLGNVVLEAWGQGVPVVSTRSEGPTWFMRDEENGLLVDIGDHEAFAAAFERLRAEPQLVSRIVAGGRTTLDVMFSEDAVVGAYMRLIEARPRG